ncbi:hypothetical protein N7475_004748 [Penicillium sp. IBT 31633x]|nr:hypothetical protein N7475_004748 [Penicillium sp. IBT 31633x]
MQHINAILLVIEVFQTRYTFSPTITNLSQLPFLSKVNHSSSPSQYILLPRSIFNRQIRMRYPNNPHPRPPTSLYSNHAIFKDQTFTRQKWGFDQLQQQNSTPPMQPNRYQALASPDPVARAGHLPEPVCQVQRAQAIVSTQIPKTSTHIDQSYY